jgi:hypothetical protein
MGQSNQRIRSNTYENLQNMMLERQQAGGAQTGGMAMPPGATGENPFDSILASSGENKGGMFGQSMAQTDFGNLQNTALGERSENTDGMRPEEEEPEGIDMGPGRATRGRRQRR